MSLLIPALPAPQRDRRNLHFDIVDGDGAIVGEAGCGPDTPVGPVGLPGVYLPLSTEPTVFSYTTCEPPELALHAACPCNLEVDRFKLHFELGLNIEVALAVAVALARSQRPT